MTKVLENILVETAVESEADAHTGGESIRELTALELSLVGGGQGAASFL